MDRALGTPRGLPRLREELRLLPADAQRDGSPAWLIQDPVSNSFFRIGWLDFEILSRWHLGRASLIARSIRDETTLHAVEADVESLDMFLRSHELVQATSSAEVDALRARAATRSRGPGEWLLHQYLFFRIPLVRPQDKLAWLARRLHWLFSRASLAALCVVTALGLVLVLHQWDSFASSFVDHLTWEGTSGFALAIASAKVLHELGHALTATRYGVRVGHMGVAVVVMFPMLYTDTSESWKLANPRQRLAIAGAGILAELALAGVATLLWALAPDGGFRTAMFFLASTSWLLTLGINASPFMRFDGYFILCDLLDFPNLHERAGKFAKAAVRRSLLGLRQAWPEVLAPVQRRCLVAFAFATWFYRLFVFLGIAVLVYVYCFKLLGIVLMAVEVGWFIARPVHAELRVWWAARGAVARPRKRFAVLAAGALVLALFVPWQSGVHGVGLVRAARQHTVYSPRAGQLVAVPGKLQVAEGDLLFALAEPELRGSQVRAQSIADARARELIGLAGVQDGEGRRASLESERDRYLAEAKLYVGEQARMQLVAPFAGQLVDVDPQLRAGVWVQSRHPLATLVEPVRWVAEVYVAEQEAGRIQAGDAARVHVGLDAIAGKVIEVDATRTAALPHAMLDAVSGGPIVTLPRADGAGAERVARDGLFRVRIALEAAAPRQQMMLCSAVIEGRRRSLIHGVFDQALSVLIRESGF